ncbi:D-serine deaminase, pyridoxal phosphate-dependent [Faunimonas pinastri]|uniref:D-serine deaminase, pyridoxal phosphate-dependent n=1 Tax=Faunimonas pinastri TaxID=1855383 RepID=A0A1H9B6T2_9HYPH|nr:DSD1 family PLP-dependent enzyme [Faunimonas pinastri]SEP84722.1 D-serine deaminase, pyridoxal phosphate-dependent [Faunimonas pinastri]
MTNPESLVGCTPDALDTPSLLVDLDVMETNVARIAGFCAQHGVAWRPHCKPHKSPDVARLEIAAGAIGITCAKLSEAEAMADAGIADILIANQIAGPIKVARLIGLRKRVDVAVCVDGEDNVQALADEAARENVVLRVLIEVDTGTRRAGVQPGEPVLQLARIIAGHPSLHFAGVMTWEGHTTRIEDQDEKRGAIEEAVGQLVASADLCRAAGIPVGIVSCGGTGTYRFSAAIPGVTEIQAGGGIFGDVRYRTIYNVPVEYGLTLLSTVTSRPNPTRVICDAGKKAMSSDAGMPIPLDIPPVASLGFSAEHGKIELREPSSLPRVGDRMRFVVGYADTTVHLHSEIFAIRHGRVEQVWRIPSGARLR